MDDSLTVTNGVNTTCGLVGDIEQEQGRGTTRTRSPSPEGSASDFSDNDTDRHIETRKSRLRKVETS